jgi:hypothetical protein
MINRPYFAYELDGYYVFSDLRKDEELMQELRQNVRFLIEDAPALANTLNPDAPIHVSNLNEAYNNAKGGMAVRFIPLVACGKSLTRTSVALIDFGSGKGKLIVSQLLTAGRLAQGFGGEGLYGVRYDEVARQFVLNMMALVMQEVDQ